jgi:hypothetical protein
MQRKPNKTPLDELRRERVQEIARIQQLSSRQKGISGEIKPWKGIVRCSCGVFFWFFFLFGREMTYRDQMQGPT